MSGKNSLSKPSSGPFLIYTVNWYITYMFILWYDIRQSLMSEGTAFPPFSRLCPRLLRKHSAWHIWHIPLTQNFHPQP